MCFPEKRIPQVLLRFRVEYVNTRDVEFALWSREDRVKEQQETILQRSTTICNNIVVDRDETIVKGDNELGTERSDYAMYRNLHNWILK